MFFVYIAIILFVFIYAVFHVNLDIFLKAGMVIIYSGVVFPIFIQNVVAKLSRRMGWWIATTFLLVGFYLVLRLMVASELLSTGWDDFSGYAYTLNFYGIIWAGLIAIAGIVNMIASHGVSGLKENVKRDLREVSVARRMTKGEPLILDKRTVVILIVGLLFTGAIFVFRIYYLKRPDLITRYEFPLEISEDSPEYLAMVLSNEANRPVDLVRVSLIGYYRYPASIKYTGQDMLEMARSIQIVAKAFKRAEAAPADMVLVEEKRVTAGNIREIWLDFSDAFEYLGLYPNETSYYRIPSKFIVKWSRKERRPEGVWVGTPGIPFMKLQNGTRMDGRGEVESSDPYEEMVHGGMFEFKDLGPGTSYGFNLSVIFHPWLGEDFRDYEEFLLRGNVVVENGTARQLAEVVIRKAT